MPDFLGLDWDLAEISDAVERNRASNTKVTGGTPIPLSGEVAKRAGAVVVEPEGFIRKAKSGSWESDLNLWEKFWVRYVAHETMEAADYHWPKGMNFVFSCLSPSVGWAKRLVRYALNSKA